MGDRTTYYLEIASAGLPESVRDDLDMALSDGGGCAEINDYDGTLSMYACDRTIGAAVVVAGKVLASLGTAYLRSFKVHEGMCQPWLGVAAHFDATRGELVVSACDDDGLVHVSADDLAALLAKHDDSPLAQDVRHAARLDWTLAPTATR